MKFLKNLDYTEVQDDNWRFYGNYLLNPKNYDDPTQATLTMVSFISKRYHALWGEQIVVDKKVSDDLAQTDLEDITFEDLPILNESLEFYFEDPKLGTFLLNTAEPKKFSESVGLYYEKKPGDENKCAFSYATKDVPQTLITKGVGNITKETLLAEAGFNIIEGAIDMLFLCFKVLIYASIPKLKPQKIGKKELRFGGKPKVKGRPHLPINRVVYLPREQIVEGQGMNERASKKYNFYGRRGFMRTYRHERYTKMQGKIQYMPPIPPKDQKPKTTYKVITTTQY